MAVTLITRTMHGISIGQRETDGYVNATALCKAHFEATKQRRDVNHWLDSQRTQETLQHLSLKTGIPVYLDYKESPVSISTLTLAA